MEEALVPVGERGQIVIPASMRKTIGLGKKSYLRVVEVEGTLVMRKVELDPLDELIKVMREGGVSRKDWELVRKWRREDVPD